MTDKRADAVTDYGGPRIFLVREQRVMLDEDLAALYRLEIGTLEQAVERNIESFSEKFAFRLSPEEFDVLKPQFTNPDRPSPLVFTGQGLGLLSSFLLEEIEAGEHGESCAPTCACRS